MFANKFLRSGLIIRSAILRAATVNGSSVVPVKYHHLAIIRPNNVRIVSPQILQHAQGFSSKAEGAEAMKLFEEMKPLCTDDIKKEINATLLFVVSGRNILFDAKADQPLKIEEVSEPPKADVTLITDEKTFIKMARGEAKPTMAFMSGKLKIKGDIKLAMKAEKIFKTVQKK